MDSDKRENIVLERLVDDHSVCIRRRQLKHHINFKCIYNALSEWKIYFLKVLSYSNQFLCSRQEEDLQQLITSQ